MDGRPFLFEGIGYHLYVSDVDHQEFCILYERFIGQMQQVIVEEEGELKPLYMSEIGWDSDYGGEEYQAQMLKLALSTTLYDRSIAMVFWFSLQDLGKEGKSYGLYRTGELVPENRKPGYEAFKAIMTGQVLEEYCE